MSEQTLFKKDGVISGGEPPMDSNYEKYLEARFANIDEKISGHLANIDHRFDSIEYDIKEVRGEIREVRGEIRGVHGEIRGVHSELKTLLYWFIGTALVIIGIFIGLFTYHAQVIQSQMQVFSDYVKAVTQPVPKVPSPQK